jgi:CelD/BcsL family acetyltransferase involved in cellulose biosynthesis
VLPGRRRGITAYDVGLREEERTRHILGSIDPETAAVTPGRRRGATACDERPREEERA